mgnify:CR=1 FL=1
MEKNDTSDNNILKKELNNSSFKEVKSAYFYRKKSLEEGYNKLRNVININKNNNKKYSYVLDETYDSLLLKTCKIIDVPGLPRINLTASFRVRPLTPVESSFIIKSPLCNPAL